MGMAASGDGDGIDVGGRPGGLRTWEGICSVSSACQALPFELWTVKVVGCMISKLEVDLLR